MPRASLERLISLFESIFVKYRAVVSPSTLELVAKIHPSICLIQTTKQIILVLTNIIELPCSLVHLIWIKLREIAGHRLIEH